MISITYNVNIIIISTVIIKCNLLCVFHIKTNRNSTLNMYIDVKTHT
jgi:hypothetical protein